MTLILCEIKGGHCSNDGNSVVVLFRFPSKMMGAAQNVASINHSRNIICDENHLYGIAVVIYSIKTRKHIQEAGYRILQKVAKTLMLVCLPCCRARGQMKQCTATISHHNKFHRLLPHARKPYQSINFLYLS